MNNSLLSRNTGRFLLAFACTATALATGMHAQTAAAALTSVADQHEAVRLDSFVVSASRLLQDPRYVSSSVTLLSLDDMHTAQVTDLRTALSQIPGVTVAGYGGAGSQSAVYIRGGSSAQTLVMVDGVRMNTRQTDFFGKSIMGGASLVGLDRIEILRGPQGTLYGSSAMGGVILMETARGCGTASGALEVGGGSFRTAYGQASVQGGTQSLGYSAALGRSVTANDRAINGDKQWNYSTRVEEKISPALLVGLTFRGIQGKYEEPGSLQYLSPGNADVNSYLATVYAEYANGGVFKSRVTTGWHQSDYFWLDLSGSIWAANAYYRSTREIVDWQNTWVASSKVSVVAGVNGEWSHFKSSNSAETLKDKSRGVYLSTDLRLLDPLSITAGLRYDHFDASGEATTGRLGTAWRFAQTDTKLRATVGTGFNAAGMTERYGDSAWYVNNPALRPEKSTGWDVGVDQSLLKGDLTVEATYFQNKFRDMIVANYISSVFKYQYQNVSRALTEGVELAVSTRFSKAVKARIAATYLDVYDTTVSRLRVPYKPRKSVDADVQWQATSAWNVGVGVHYVADRMRAVTATASNRIGDYSSARIYTSYEVAKNLLIKFRVENALNHPYEEIYGYPALPRGYFGGVEWKF